MPLSTREEAQLATENGELDHREEDASEIGKDNECEVPRTEESHSPNETEKEKRIEIAKIRLFSRNRK